MDFNLTQVRENAIYIKETLKTVCDELNHIIFFLADI